MKKYAVEDFITGKEIKRIRKRLGLTQADFAELVKVSKKTVERWEAGENRITGPIITLIKLLWENPKIEEVLQIPKKIYPLRMWYMFRGEVCTIIDIDDRLRKIKICNYTKDPIRRAFGKNDDPNYEDYEEFLESRCFPRSRDKMKIMLKELNLPFYDPYMIVEKTQGRMAEDEFWIRIER